MRRKKGNIFQCIYFVNSPSVPAISSCEKFTTSVFSFGYSRSIRTTSNHLAEMDA
jgi:hypothetical protein